MLLHSSKQVINFLIAPRLVVYRRVKIILPMESAISRIPLPGEAMQRNIDPINVSSISDAKKEFVARDVFLKYLHFNVYRIQIRSHLGPLIHLIGIQGVQLVDQFTPFVHQRFHQQVNTLLLHRVKQNSSVLKIQPIE